MTPVNPSLMEAAASNDTFLAEVTRTAVVKTRSEDAKLITASQSRNAVKSAALQPQDEVGPNLAADVELPGEAASPRSFIWYSRTYSVFLTAEEAVLTITHPGSYGPAHKWFEPARKARKAAGPAENIAVVRMRLLGSNPESSGAVSWSGKPPAKKTLGRESEVRYRDIYPGVDIVYHSDLHRLKYDFVLTPGGDPNAIRLRFSGADGIRADKNGSLVLQVPGGRLRWQEPVIYREQAGRRLKVAGRYVVTGGNEVTFAAPGITATPLTSAVVAPAIPLAP